MDRIAIFSTDIGPFRLEGQERRPFYLQFSRDKS